MLILSEMSMLIVGFSIQLARVNSIQGKVRLTEWQVFASWLPFHASHGFLSTVTLIITCHYTALKH